MSNEFANIGLDLIASSLTNPRKNFNQAKLAELAESIKADGVHQPVLVRHIPADRVPDTDRQVIYELVCGERRLRASRMAGVSTIPAMIRNLTDAQVLEIQIIENLHRDDLTELEEAEGYEALMQHANITADQVGEKIKKSRSHVYARLKLLDLCTEARASLRDGDIDASRALVVARIPDHKLQIKAMKEIVAGQGYSSPREPMTYRQALDHAQRNYMLKLSDAKFKITSVDLVPAAGSCKTCTKRTGHAPDLFSDVKGADVCIDPPCFHKKEEAHSAAMVKEAKDKGQTVIAGKEAQELRAQNSYYDKFVGYRRLDSVDDSPTDQPLRKLIGPLMKTEGIKPVLIEGTRNKGELVECLPNEVALKLLKMAEQQAAAASQQTTNAPKISKEVQKLVDEKKAKDEAKAKAQYEQDWRDQLVQRTWDLIQRSEGFTEDFNTEVHRYVALRTAHNLSSDDLVKVAQLLGLGKVGAHSAIQDHIKISEQPDVIHLLMIMVKDSSANDFSYSDRIANEGMHLVAGIVHGGGLKSTLKDLQANSLAKFFPKVKVEKAKPTNAPAAQAKGSGVGKKPKTTAQEAKAQIAAAMQAQEGTNPGADAPGIVANDVIQPVAPPGASAPTASQAVGEFEVGQRVRVTTDDNKLGPIARKWSGKEGTITRREDGGGYWCVTFKGRNGGMALFAEDQIEVVAVAVAA
jgi:ParB/RepB/Spo0J family partition protein